MIYLCIAGHGPRRNGTFDAGATGVISKGEYRYMKENFFPAMKKYTDNKFVFFDKYNVFDRGNIVALARSYGKRVAVIEFHYDAASSAARGGHVIIHRDYVPDKMDLRIRDAIKAMTGIRYSHKGYAGISGRNNLANVNRTRRGGVNYRLVELGFGTNSVDAEIMMTKTDEYARRMVEAITGKKVNASSGTTEGWVKNTTGWWYRNKDGSYPRGGWKYIGKQWYLFNSNGYMLTGWQKSKGKWYYMNSSGHMQKGWIKLGEDWFYLNSSGAMLRYWFQTSEGGPWFYANSSGRMQTGWLKDKHGRWFYLHENGYMATGLLEVGGKHYFLQPNGALITEDVIELEANRHGHLDK